METAEEPDEDDEEKRGEEWTRGGREDGYPLPRFVP